MFIKKPGEDDEEHKEEDNKKNTEECRLSELIGTSDSSDNR